MNHASVVVSSPPPFNDDAPFLLAPATASSAQSPPAEHEFEDEKYRGELLQRKIRATN